jgi:hypothetical protein
MGGAGAPVPRATCETCGEFCPHACAPVVLITRERWTGRRVVTIRDREPHRRAEAEREPEAG